MTVIEEVIETFRNTNVSAEFSTSEIKKMVHDKFGRTKESVIPTDFCYNRVNNGIDFCNHPKIFEYIGRGKFRYLGMNYPYSGKVYHQPKKESEICIGEFINGKFQVF